MAEERNPQLSEVSESITSCKSCHLCRTRKHAVPGEGAASSWIMFVGEAPGGQEDLEGRPFVGSAGRFLDELLQVAGLRREEVFITNVVKCRPPSNRAPRKEEVQACRPHLEAQLRIIRPRLVCTMGAVALKSMLGIGSVTRARGKPILRNDVVYFPTLHPAASLYDPKLKDTLREDFDLLGRLVEEGPDDLEGRFAALSGLRTLDFFARNP